jgi:hypothetical protein
MYPCPLIGSALYCTEGLSFFLIVVCRYIEEFSGVSGRDTNLLPVPTEWHTDAVTKLASITYHCRTKWIK